MTTSEIIVKTEQGIGHITLNRPQALHALTLGMCKNIIAALLDWEADPKVSEVIVDHSGPRGFCAGGDLRLLYQSLQTNDLRVLDFFHTEYRMNHLLFTCRKPVTCMMDGIVMGGGAGIAMACAKRVATAATQFAMPETGIGLFPDVGGGWFLSRLPGRIGEWLALTGTRLNASDCLLLGLATEPRPGDQLLPASIDKMGDQIDSLFAADHIEDIFAALQADPSDFACQQLAVIRKRAPVSCKVALRQLRESRKLTSFENNMKMEFRLAQRMLARPDIREGIRAFIIDKDSSPRWSPRDFADVTDADIDQIFESLPEACEWTPLQRN